MKNRKAGAKELTENLDRVERQAEKPNVTELLHTVDLAVDQLELLHELRGRQIELEIRNEELRRVQQELSELHKRYEDLYEFAPCGYLNLDSQGIIIRTNLAGAVLLNDLRSRILHTGFSRFLVPDCENHYARALQEIRRSGKKQSLELQLEGNWGGSCWVWAEIQQDRANSGEGAGYLLTLVNISGRKEVETAPAGSERKYRQLFNEMVCGAVLLRITGNSGAKGCSAIHIVEVNSGFERMMDIQRDQAVGMTPGQVFGQPEKIWHGAIARAVRTGIHVELEQFYPELSKHLLISFFPLDAGLAGATILDISEAKSNEAKLGKTCRDLEIVVRERTHELRQTRLELAHEADARKTAQRELLEKSGEITLHIAELEDTNAALRVLLRERDSERARLEEKVVCNLNELVRPQLARLAEGQLSLRQRSLLESIGSSLDEIASPLSRRFILQASRLTPIETQVAEYIRQGRSTKEIAGLMGVAVCTIDYHRLNIRRRLGLTSKSINLQSYLRSLL